MVANLPEPRTLCPTFISRRQFKMICLFLFLLLVITALLGILFKTRVDTFKSRNVPYNPFSLEDLQLFRKVHYQIVTQNTYDMFKDKGPVTGCFLGFTPFFMVNDPELARKIMIKDFNYFDGRGLFNNEKVDAIGANLFTLRGEKWRTLRQKISPQFSSGKIKAMLPTMLEISDVLNEAMVERSQSDPEWDMKNVLQRFTADVIGALGFGLECNGLKARDPEFVRYGVEALNEASDQSNLKGLFKLEFRALARFLGMRRFPEKAEKFYRNIVQQTIQYREEQNIVKDDIMNAMIQLKKENLVTLDEVTAQCFLFLAAGFETTSALLNFMFYYFARYQDLQDKMREEVLSVIRKYDNKVTYEALAELETVDKFISGELWVIDGK